MSYLKTLGLWLGIVAFAVMAPGHAFAQCGIASWYGGQFHGRLTANGERYNQNGVSAAHKTLPFGTRVQVRNQRNGRTMVVRINDRGPYVAGRIIDLSRGAKAAFGAGDLASVCLTVLSRGNGRYVGRAVSRKLASRGFSRRIASRLSSNRRFAMRNSSRKVASRNSGRRYSLRGGKSSRRAALMAKRRISVMMTKRRGRIS